MTIAIAEAQDARAGARQEALVGLRIVLVDDWHEQWPQVLTQIERAGHRAELRMYPPGWLSARENVLAALVGDRVAGHLSFCVKPAPAEPTARKRRCVEAQVDSYAIDPDFRDRGIERVLRDTAIERARVLQCRGMKGFDLAESWS
jgi:GNAT superfamily N-acetyltransferase